MIGQQNIRSFIAVIIAVTPLFAGTAQAAPESHWYRGNTHVHTNINGGTLPPEGVVKWYRDHAFDFLFITDHENLTDVGPLNISPDFLVLPGQEITQSSEDPARPAAHVNNLFASKLIMPVKSPGCAERRCREKAPASMTTPETYAINIGAVRQQGGIAQINHPNWEWSVKPEDLYGVPDGVLIEIWNGQGHINNLGGRDDNGDFRPSAEGFWDILLSRGKLVWGVGTDDSHDFGPPDITTVLGAIGTSPGQSWIVVRAPSLTAANIRKSIELGQFYASNGVTLDDIASDGKSLTIQITPPFSTITAAQSKDFMIDLPRRYLTRFIGRDGNTLAEISGTHPSYRFRGTEAYVRAVITDSNGKRAWTQPIFLDKRRKDYLSKLSN